MLDSTLELSGDLVVKAFPWHEAPRHILVPRSPTLIRYQVKTSLTWSWQRLHRQVRWEIDIGTL